MMKGQNGITLIIALFFLFAYAPDQAVVTTVQQPDDTGGSTDGGDSTDGDGSTDGGGSTDGDGSTDGGGSTDVYGCTDPGADNYDPSATVDDGSCQYTQTDVYGCTDPNANNYDPNANVDDGSCNYDVYGCTDPGADNYDPAATVDDGSCQYSQPAPECSDGFDNDGDGPIDSEDIDCFYDDPVEGMIYCPNWNSESFSPATREECDQGF